MDDERSNGPQESGLITVQERRLGMFIKPISRQQSWAGRTLTRNHDSKTWSLGFHKEYS